MEPGFEAISSWVYVESAESSWADLTSTLSSEPIASNLALDPTARTDYSPDSYPDPAWACYPDPAYGLVDKG